MGDRRAGRPRCGLRESVLRCRSSGSLDTHRVQVSQARRGVCGDGGLLRGEQAFAIMGEGLGCPTSLQVRKGVERHAGGRGAIGRGRAALNGSEKVVA